MSKIVIDASVAIKTVVAGPHSREAVLLFRTHQLTAPDLLIAECSNILWKKVRARQFPAAWAPTAAQAIAKAKIDLVPMSSLAALATQLAVELDHPAYDCMYLALARSGNLQFVTADERLVRKMRGMTSGLSRVVISLPEAASEMDQR